MHALSVGLIGCGAIGKVLTKAIDSGSAGNVQLIMVYDRNLHKAVTIVKMLKSKPFLTKSLKNSSTPQRLDS